MTVRDYGAMDWSADRRLVEMAEGGEEVITAEGVTPSGLPLLVVVAVGTHVGLLRQRLGAILNTGESSGGEQ